MMDVCDRCTPGNHSGTNGTPGCIALVHDANGCTALAPDLGACACPCRQNDEQLTNEEQAMTTTAHTAHTAWEAADAITDAAYAEAYAEAAAAAADTTRDSGERRHASHAADAYMEEISRRRSHGC